MTYYLRVEYIMGGVSYLGSKLSFQYLTRLLWLILFDIFGFNRFSLLNKRIKGL